MDTGGSNNSAFFQHEAAIVESTSIGERTRVWAFAHILPNARIGADCNICDHTFIENEVLVGDRVTIKCGVQLWDGVTLESDVFVGPSATFTNDRFPRSRQERRRTGPTIVRKGASIGANATILPGIVIGERAMVGAGSVVTRDVPADTVVAGNPARIIGYVGIEAQPLQTPSRAISSPLKPSAVRGATLHRLPLIEDLRGCLTFGEARKHIPFEIKRFFLVFDVKSREIRGEHAHREQHQFLICVRGSCHSVADDGECREEFILDDPTLGLHLEPMVWGVQYKYSADAVLLVLTSDIYDAEDYIRNYDEFLAAEKRSRRAE